ncbi:T-lymphocyte activation antigen CD80 [Syngnathus typhle]|uniref:T-lymphocyte activation antigen CD80 n=1 Tax=Syngnathus typhle TaxID=161592 RepID=UPI002A69950C|nr:T-lymphocyte activation antigen CD80 [Syngnathus typhle]
MTMGFADFVLWLLMVLCFGGQHTLSGFIEMDCKESLGQYGQPSVVECEIKMAPEAKDDSVRIVVWKKGVSILLKFHDDQFDPTLPPGYSLEPSWNSKSLNVSLLIANTSVINHGNYSCFVMTESGTANKSASLHVTAKYKTPSIHTTTTNVGSPSRVTLTCRSEGGYPKGRLGWFVGTTGQEESAETVAEAMGNGLFSLSSKLTLSLGRDPSTYTCMVFNASGGKDSEASVVLPDHVQVAGIEQEPQAKDSDVAHRVVAPLVVIGSLIVGLLLFWVIRGRPCKRAPEAAEPEVLEAVETDQEQGNSQDPLIVTSEYQESNP